jgi:hypothetical protein
MLQSKKHRATFKNHLHNPAGFFNWDASSSHHAIQQRQHLITPKKYIYTMRNVSSCLFSRSYLDNFMSTVDDKDMHALVS